jgi:hypothetical protein
MFSIGDMSGQVRAWVNAGDRNKFLEVFGNKPQSVAGGDVQPTDEPPAPISLLSDQHRTKSTI